MPQIVRDLFEQEFQKYFDVPHAIAVNSGTSALIATLWSLDMQPGDEVITTPFTFAATTMAILIAGGTPVFVDINESDSLINTDLIEAAITERTRAILPVHLFGRVCNMLAIDSIATKHNLIVIEDTAQSLAAEYLLGFAGTVSDAGCFSFYKTKNLSTFEGGMILIPAKSKLDASRIRKITSPTANKPEFEEVGFNFRMPEPCALIGLEQIKLRMDTVVNRLGNYDENDGFYPYVTYQLAAVKNRGVTGRCPVAESKAAAIKKKFS